MNIHEENQRKREVLQIVQKTKCTKPEVQGTKINEKGKIQNETDRKKRLNEGIRETE